MTLKQDAQTQSGNEEQIKFFVNDEEVVFSYQKTSDRKRIELTVREILEIAGFDPPEEWELTRDSDNHTYTSPDDTVEIEFGESFTATHTGITPTS